MTRFQHVDHILHGHASTGFDPLKCCAEFAAQIWGDADYFPVPLRELRPQTRRNFRLRSLGQTAMQFHHRNRAPGLELLPVLLYGWTSRIERHEKIIPRLLTSRKWNP